MDEPDPTPSSGGPVTASIEPDAQSSAVAYRWRLAGLMLWLVVLLPLFSRAITASTGDIYTQHLGGFITAVNYPGPKVWATSFLQRSIGFEPGPLGVSTTLWAFLSVLAIWLMTVSARGESSAIRLTTRWSAVIGVGLVASVLFYQTSIGIIWNPPKLIYPVLSLTVEVIATLFVYVYLARLALRLGRRNTAKVLFFGGLAAAVLIVLGIFTVIEGETIKANSRALGVQAMAACYGTASVALALVLVGSLLQLIPAFYRSAFPDGIGMALRTDHTAEARPVCGSCGYDLRGSPDNSACPECGDTTVINQDAEEANRLESTWARFVATGCIVFALVPFPLLYVIFHMDFRDAFGGTLPMLNFVGPKAWGVPALQRSIGYQPEALGSDGALYCLACMLAVWLMTWPHPVRVLDEKWHDLRRLTRWSAALAGGAFMGFALISQDLYVNSEGFWKWLFAAVLVAEAPATVLCYLYLARLAGQYLNEREASMARWTARLAFGVMAVSLVVLPFGQSLDDLVTGEVTAWVFAAGYGSVMFGSGLLGFAVVLSMASKLTPIALRGMPALVIARG